MAVLWIHTASLLVLLVTSCQGTQAAVAQHLCGSHLVDALYLVCGHNGFRFTPGISDPQQSFIPPRVDRAQPAVGWNEPAESTFTDQTMVKRDVVQQCCIRPCTLFDLLSYCLPSFE